jgi:hypothetical protein
MRTITERLLRRLTTRTCVPSGRLLCAAVKPSDLYFSPLAVRPGCSYQAARPLAMRRPDGDFRFDAPTGAAVNGRTAGTGSTASWLVGGGAGDAASRLAGGVAGSASAGGTISSLRPLAGPFWSELGEGAGGAPPVPRSNRKRSSKLRVEGAAVCAVTETTPWTRMSSAKHSIGAGLRAKSFSLFGMGPTPDKPAPGAGLKPRELFQSPRRLISRLTPRLHRSAAGVV